MNDDGALFALLKLKRLGIGSAFNVGKMRRMRAAVQLASDQYFMNQMDYKGNLVQLGGMFIVDCGAGGGSGESRRFVYQHRDQYAGDSPLVREVLQVLGVPDSLAAKLFPDIVADGGGGGNSEKRFLQLAQDALLAMRRRQAAEATSAAAAAAD